jgi:hypothetical protein
VDKQAAYAENRGRLCRSHDGILEQRNAQPMVAEGVIDS